jgi:hypothetical protein
VAGRLGVVEVRSAVGAYAAVDAAHHAPIRQRQRGRPAATPGTTGTLGSATSNAAAILIAWSCSGASCKGT